MKITVTTVTDYVFELDVHEELELENFKAFCEVESGFPSTEIVIIFKGQPLLDDKKSLKDHGIGDGDVVLLQHALQAASLLSQAANRTSAAGNRGGNANRMYFVIVCFRIISNFYTISLNLCIALAGLDFSAIQVPNSGSSGSLSGSLGASLGASPGASLGGSLGGSGQQQPPISIGMNDDPAIVREAFFKNPDQLALVRISNIAGFGKRKTLTSLNNSLLLNFSSNKTIQHWPMR